MNAAPTTISRPLTSNFGVSTTTTTRTSTTPTSLNMKALPRSPAASSATITATMMSKAFHHNTHKRGLTEMMAAPPPPPTPTASTNNNHNSQNHSLLDCGSLQSSLKRVRLSSCPGELRLQRDLRHLVTSGQWQPQPPALRSPTQHQDDVWMWHPPAPPVTARMSRAADDPHQNRHVELRQVESLRLRLTFERNVVVWIQIPRMYPHRPPLISRIVYHPNQDQQRLSSSPSPLSGIQRIVVHEAPPGVLGTIQRDNHHPHHQQTSQATGAGEEMALSFAGGGGGGNENDTYHQRGNRNCNKTPNFSPTNSVSGTMMTHHTSLSTLHCANTVVYNDWSPIQRLGDLLEFVIQVLQEQQNDSNNRKQQQQRSYYPDMALTYSSSSSSSCSISNSNSTVSTSNTSTTSLCGLGANGLRSSTCSTSSFGFVEEHKQPEDCDDSTMTTTRPSDVAEGFLDPNRFNVGYTDRADMATGVQLRAVGGDATMDDCVSNATIHPVTPMNMVASNLCMDL